MTGTTPSTRHRPRAARPELTAKQEDIDAVRRTALDYIEGYLQGDPERHARAYHPECIKRRYTHDTASGVDELVVLSPRIMSDYAALVDIEDPEPVDVVIDAISEGIASVRVYSHNWIDFLHIAKARGEWKLFHITWHDLT